MGLIEYLRRRMVFKIGVVTLSAIALSFAVYSYLTGRRAAHALESETRASSQRLASGIISGIRSSMLGGNGILVRDLIADAKQRIPTVEIRVFDPHGNQVFEAKGPAPAAAELPPALAAVMATGQPRDDGGLVHSPLANEERCHACHSPTEALRGVLAVRLDASSLAMARGPLLETVVDDAFKRIMTAKKSALLDDYFAEVITRTPSVAAIAVFDNQGASAFGKWPDDLPGFKEALAGALLPGARPAPLMVGGGEVRLLPLPLEKRCQECHHDGKPVRGVLALQLAAGAPGRGELEGVIDTSLRNIMMASLGRLVTGFLDTVAGTHAVTDLRLYDPEGRLYYDAFARPTPPKGVGAVLASHRARSMQGPRGTLIVVEPLQNDERCMRCHGDDMALRGAVEIRASNAAATAQLHDALASAVRVAGITVFAVFLLLWLALKFLVVDPVKRIGDAAERIGDGDLSIQVPGARKSGDEVSRLAARMNEMLHGLRSKLHLEKFVSRGAQAAAASAGAEGAMLSREGERRLCTVLFTDIRGFTGYSEKASPEQVVRMLNKLLAAQAEVVTRHGGDIDKFVGDELMAVFMGPDAPRRAVLCGLDMIAAVDQAREGGSEAIAVGGGISHGDVVYGAIGHEARLDYTVIGDVVNTGARLCSAAAPSELLVSVATREACGELPHVAFEPIEPLKLKGKRIPLKTYRVRRVG